jgi:epoxyqueuosine reductase
MNKSILTHKIKAKAIEIGFDYCGVSKAEFLKDEAPKLENWLANNYHGSMSYMQNYFDQRLNPTLLVDGAKSVVSVLLNYYPTTHQNSESAKVSKYAYGVDYHFVLKKKLNTLLEFIKEISGNVNARIFVDSAPVMDKVWAKKSGLGWIGKNSNLINKNSGSFFFIAELICDLELEYDGPVKDFCGTCTKCIDSCPTNAIVEPFVVDGSKCISHFTIELKEQIPLEYKGKFENWMFGCDICQDVCPWNRFSSPNTTKEFEILPELKNNTNQEWEEITEDVFNKVFKNSPLKRTKYSGLKRNFNFLKF